ncbi:MAG TPA: hypothetical protein VF331_16685 [Polyangiales bacterium]
MRPSIAAALGLLWLAACTSDKTTAGRACRSDAECAAQSCVAKADGSAEDLAAMPLVCGAPTDKLGPGEACEHGPECALGICLLSGACASPCATDAHCAATERCQAVYARAGNAVLQTLHACVAMVDLPKDAHIKIEIRRHALSGAQDDIKLPGTSVPTLFVLEHLSDHSWPIPPDPPSACRPPLCTDKLVENRTPSDVLFDESAIDMQAAGPKNPVANGDHVNPVTVLIPNSPRVTPSSAGYTLTTTSTLAGDLRLTTLARTTRGHKLDLNVYYVGAQDWSSTGDRGPMLLTDALGVVDEIFAPADIFIGDVRQLDVRGKLLTEGVPLPEGAPLPEFEASKGFSPIAKQYGVYPQLPELWKLSAGAGNVALDLFFVSDLAPIGSGDVGAIAGGTPGPLGMHGTAGSGIAVSTNLMLAQNDPKALGRTLAHEIGHMLGLFHTVEVDGTVRDPFSDTAACTIDHDTNGNGFLEARECASEGGDNLMFPTVSAQSTTLSAQQQELLRSALILQ